MIGDVPRPRRQIDPMGPVPGPHNMTPAQCQAHIDATIQDFLADEAAAIAAVCLGMSNAEIPKQQPKWRPFT